jgi:putative thioredoxin
MGAAVTVSNSDFATEVLEKSYEKPVLVDFFAHWCGPCQMLKPLLEKLVQEYDFILAKVDIDANPDLANAYGVQGVPDVRIVRNGEVAPGFVGVLPEPQLRQLLEQLNLQSDLDRSLAQVQAAIASNDLLTAKNLYGTLLEQYPQDRKLLIDAARFLVMVNQLDAVDPILASIQEYEKEYAAAKAVKALAQFKREVNEAKVETEWDEQFLKATRLTLAEDYEAALDRFLDIVSRNRRYKNDAARKAMITIFDLLGDDDPLTKDYRKKLTMALY